MEIRRVQMTGGSSFIITLPKEWVTALHIKKNDPIGLLQQSNGTILITPRITREGVHRTKNFSVTAETDQNKLFRRLIGAYIEGYNSIHITSKTRVTPQIKAMVRSFTQIVIGQEIVEETDKTIIVKDLLNPAEMPFQRTLKRMHIMVKAMYQDAMQALIEQDQKIAEDVIARDSEIDRLHWLIARQHKIILRNVNFAEKMGTNISTATTSFLISRIIERIGDHVVTIASNIISLKNQSLDPSFISALQEASNLSLESFNRSVGAFFRKEINAANDNIESIVKVRKKCEELNTFNLKLEAAPAISLGYIIESIRRIGEYAEDISENVINHLIGEEY
jgi:phosphate uptake regulator